MKYTIATWNIKKLCDIYNKEKLNLLISVYQRSTIWNLKEQQALIESIHKGFPIPSFLLLDKGQGKYEMIDGQQRVRTILGFIKHGWKDFKGRLFSVKHYPKFLDFTFLVIIISGIQEKSLRKFYALLQKI